jgi:hypothetical protein
LSNTAKLGIALRSAATSVGGEAGAKLAELLSPTNLAIMAGALAIWIGAQATPIGWVVNIGMIGLGVIALGVEAITVMRELQAFGVGVITAKTEADLSQAGKHLAKAVAIVGVDVVVAILLKKAVIKIREPGLKMGDQGSKKLFGKYDPKDATRQLPAEKKAPDTGSTAVAASTKAATTTRTPEEIANRARVAALIKKARAQGDPGVAKLISQLEKSGVKVKDTNHYIGNPLREVDIETANGTIIQVKKLSSAQKIIAQVQDTERATGQTTVGFVVEQHRKASAVVQQAGQHVKVTNDVETLLGLLKGD